MDAHFSSNLMHLADVNIGYLPTVISSMLAQRPCGSFDSTFKLPCATFGLDLEKSMEF